MIEVLFLARATLLDVDGGEQTLVHQVTVKVKLHIARSFELLEDDFVHTRARLDQCRGKDRERAALFDVTRGAEEALRLLQGIGIDAAGENLAGVRLQGIVGARQTRDRVEKDDDVLLVFDHALGLFDNHLGNLNVAFGWFVERAADHLSRATVALGIGHFFGTLVDEQDDDVRIGMVLRDGVGHLLQQDRLARTRRGDDQAALSFADRCKQIHRAHVDFLAHGFQDESRGGEERRQVVEEDFVLRLLGVFLVYRLDLEQRKETFLVLGWTNLPGDDIACLQIEAANLRRRDVYVLGTRQLIVARRTQESETVRQDFQHALAEHQTATLGIGTQDAEDEFVLLEGADALDAK